MGKENQPRSKDYGGSQKVTARHVRDPAGAPKMFPYRTSCLFVRLNPGIRSVNHPMPTTGWTGTEPGRRSGAWAGPANACVRHFVATLIGGGPPLVRAGPWR